jgi:nitrite reductase/ring-hydroxylating ferredoxin subunit
MTQPAMIEVGQLSRDVGASRARAIEDEMDWEHLPYVHASTFDEVELIEESKTGWCANVVLKDGTAMEMRVSIDEDGCGYTNATFTDGVENGRAECRVEDTGPDSCRMDFRFFIPEDSPFPREMAGPFYSEMFSRLVDEDEPKMIHRTAALAAGARAHKPRREVLLADGSTVQVPLVCPHQGLPLECEPDAAGIMTCPWHGHRFDARTGRCVSGHKERWAV